MKIDFLPWLWLWYPISVVMVILFSLNYIFMSSNSLQNLKNKKEHVENQEQLGARLKIKLQELQTLDQDQVLRNFKTLTTIVPAGKQVVNLINELQTSANEAQVTLSSYQINATPVLSFSLDLEVPTLDTMQKFLSYLENKAPLIEVQEVHWEKGKVKMVIDAVESPRPQFTSDPKASLPTETTSFDSLRPKIEVFVPVINEDETKLPQTGTNPNPFKSFPEAGN